MPAQVIPTEDGTVCCDMCGQGSRQLSSVYQHRDTSIRAQDLFDAALVDLAVYIAVPGLVEGLVAFIRRLAR
jgi:hypothetical protein